MASLPTGFCSDTGCSRPVYVKATGLCRAHHRAAAQAQMAEGSKVCTVCGETKPLDDFGLRAERGGFKRRPRCRECDAARTREWKRKNPDYAIRWREANRDKWNSYRLLQQFGIVQADVDAMLKAQAGLCAICAVEMDKPNVDHCHASGKVRGLLCRACNLALGFLQDDPDRIDRAAAYVRRHATS